MKLSKKQKQVIEYIRGGWPLHWYYNTQKYYQNNEKGRHAVVRDETVHKLIFNGLVEAVDCPDYSTKRMALTELGKTIEL
jgi:hypothetical protein